MNRLDIIQHSDASRVWAGLRDGGSAPPPVWCTPGYSAAMTRWDMVRVLVVGAGGIGCELLHLLILSGLHPSDITVLDMDRIALSNLNRQFLFREADVGKWKSEVAASRASERFFCGDGNNGTETREGTGGAGGGVRAVVGRVEDQPVEFFKSFHAFFLAVDAVEPRRWLNRFIAQRVAEWGPVVVRRQRPCEGVQKRWMWGIRSAPPILDCGTEGFQGHCRVVRLGREEEEEEEKGGQTTPTPCIECTLYLFQEEEEENGGGVPRRVPLCTLENIPRRPEHCVVYAREYLWEVEQQKKREQARQQHVRDNNHNHKLGEEEEEREEIGFDVDNPEHIAFVTEAARERQRQFHLGPPPEITESFARNVLRRVVSAVSFSNAFVAAQAVTEFMKMLTGVGPALQNYSYVNGDGASPAAAMHAVVEALRPNLSCPVCGPIPLVILQPQQRAPLAQEEEEKDDDVCVSLTVNRVIASVACAVQETEKEEEEEEEEIERKKKFRRMHFRLLISDPLFAAAEEAEEGEGGHREWPPPPPPSIPLRYVADEGDEWAEDDSNNDDNISVYRSRRANSDVVPSARSEGFYAVVMDALRDHFLSPPPLDSAATVDSGSAIGSPHQSRLAGEEVWGRWAAGQTTWFVQVDSTSWWDNDGSSRVDRVALKRCLV